MNQNIHRVTSVDLSVDLSAGDLVIRQPGAVSALLLQRARHHGIRILAAEVQEGAVREGGV